MTNKNFHIFIPARMDSTRLAKKMLVDVHGLPLIIRVAKQAQQTKAATVIVATDHSDIIALCQQYEVEAELTSSTHQSGSDRIAELVNKINFNPDDLIINLQGDEALIDPLLIDQLADFSWKKSALMATIAHPINIKEEFANPNIVKVVLDYQQNALYFSRANIPYDRNKNFTELQPLRHSGVYAYQIKFLQLYTKLDYCFLEHLECLEQLRALYYGYKIAVMLSDMNPSIGIDSMEDLIQVRKILADQENATNN